MRLFRRKTNAGLMSIEEYAAHKDKHPTTIYRHAEKEILAAVKIIDGKKYINQIKADALYIAAETGKYRNLHMLVAQCKVWCKRHWFPLTVTILLLATWVILPGTLSEYQRRGHALKALEVENQELRASVDEMLGLSDKYVSLMDISEALGLDLDEALAELKKENPNVTIPELTLFALLDRSNYFADWISQEVSVDRGKLFGYIAQAEVTPNVWPTQGRVSGEYGSRYAARGSKLAEVLGKVGLGWHSGIDIAASTGTPVYSTALGNVSHVGWSDGYGNVVIVDHGDLYQTVYAHLDRIVVEVGAQVSRGDKVGTVGSTGTSTGPHLHYEVRVHGEPVNPRRYLP